MVSDVVNWNFPHGSYLVMDHMIVIPFWRRFTIKSSSFRVMFLWSEYYFVTMHVKKQNPVRKNTHVFRTYER